MLITKVTRPFDPKEWEAFYFSLQCYPWIKHEGHENKGNDHHIKNLLIVKKKKIIVNTLVYV